MSTPLRTYLDHNATHPVLPAVAQAVAEAVGVWGNPSSLHAEGRKARALIEGARGAVAELFGADRMEVVFTSGGTEADVLGIMACARAAIAMGLPRVVATTAIEHPAVRGAVLALREFGFTIRELPLTANGVLVVEQAVPRLADVGMCALALVNHEIGVVQPLAALAEALRPTRALLHVDAVAAAGRISLADAYEYADTIAISAHKLGGIKGAGAVCVRARGGERGVHLGAALPLVEAGSQERGRRPGTESPVAIAGFGVAAAHALQHLEHWPQVAALGANLEAGLAALPQCTITAAAAPRIGGTINARFAGARGESIVIGLDLAGVATSTGAACTSGSIKPSAVLLGLGLSDDEARSAVRFSLGHGTSAQDITRVLALLPPIVERARKYRGNAG